MQPVIKQEEEGNKGNFYIEQDGKVIALMSYMRVFDTKIVITHTEVRPSGRGQKLGEALLKHTVQFARDNHLKVQPLCPFASAQMLKHKEQYLDILTN